MNEFAWVIERSDSPVEAPLYWAGGTWWSRDNLDAIRFARQVDAERAARFLPVHPHHRIAEHGWCSP